MSDYLQDSSRLADEAVKECARLLSGAQFEFTRGSYLQGSGVAVSILVNEDLFEEDVYSIQVICHVDGHLRVDWEGIAILIESGESGEAFPGFLDSGGKVMFRVRRHARTGAGIEISTTCAHVGTAGVLLAKAAAKADEAHRRGDPSTDLFAFSQVSRDGRATATAKMHPGGLVEIRVDTKDPALKGGRAYVYFRSIDGESGGTDRIPLSLEDANGYFGIWLGEIPFSKQTEIYVVAFPPKNR
jgi:hypothetical protein